MDCEDERGAGCQGHARQDGLKTEERSMSKDGGRHFVSSMVRLGINYKALVKGNGFTQGLGTALGLI